MAARGHSKIVTYEEINIYSFVIPLFQLFFYGELISGLFKSRSCFVCKIQNGRLIQYWNCNLWRNSNIFLCNFFFCIIFHEKPNFGFNIVNLMSFHISKWPPLTKKNNFRNYVIFCLHIFLFGNIAAVKNISGIKGGYAMWFSPVNCPRCCSSLSCDNNNYKLGCMKLLRWQQRTLCHCACHNNLPHQDGSTCPWYY